MNYSEILQRALKITWTRRSLWLFGVLLALVSGNPAGGFRGYSFSGRDLDFRGWDPSAQDSFTRWLQYLWENISRDWGRLGIPWNTLGKVLILLGVLMVVWLLVSLVIRYFAQNALIRMVAHVEETQGPVTVGEGFRLGWTRPAWHMFLIDLVLGVPFALAAVLLIAIGASPLLLLLVDAVSARAVGIGLTVLMMLFIVALLVLAGIVLGVIAQLAYRQAALSGKGTLESIAEAYRMLREHFSNVAVIWLLLLAIGIGWGLVLLPIFVVLFVLAAVMGGAPAFLMYQTTRTVWPALLIGVPVGIVVIGLPLLFLTGLYQTFVSAVWTLTYRELWLKEVGLGSDIAPTEGGAFEGGEFAGL